jgi:hypothetical protein
MINDATFLEMFLIGMNNGFKYIDRDSYDKSVYMVFDESEFKSSSQEKSNTSLKAEIIILKNVLTEASDPNLVSKSFAEVMGQRCMVELVDLMINGNPESDSISGLNYTNKNEAYFFIKNIDFGSETEESGDLVLVANLDIDYYFA